MLDRKSSIMTRKVFLAMVLVHVALFSFGQSVGQSGRTGSSVQDIEVAIRFFDKEIYTPSSTVMVQLTVRNNGLTPFRFRLAENPVYNVDIDVRTAQGTTLTDSEEFSNSRQAVQPVFYREISLGTREEYSILLDLDQFVVVDTPGVYTISAEFYPELNYISGQSALDSNELILSMIPDFADADDVSDRITEEGGLLLVQEDLSPDEVVRQTILARMQDNWDRFFLYMDLEELYTEVPARRRTFTGLSAAEQELELAEFRETLQNSNTDEQIADRPISYQILSTYYTPTEGEVTAEQRYEYPDFVEVRRYTYQLERRDNVWEITGYTVQNRGTEAP